MKHPTVVVGAGLSGLIVARALAARGEAVVVFEKSRGVGGRLATKRVGQAVFDQGAQFFTVRDPEFRALVDEWQSGGVVAPWPGNTHGRFIGRPSMTAVPKALSAGLDIRREHKVARLSRDQAGAWEIEVDGQGMVSADRVILSAPVPQSLALLAAGSIALPEQVAAALQAVDYHPCLALLVVLDGPSQVPEEGVAFKEGALRWIADNVRKGVSSGVPAAVTLHAAPEFARACYSLDEAEIAARLLPAAAPWLGEAKVVSTTLHRWKFSEPRGTYPEACLWLPDLRLGFCGDGFGGPRVEGAAVSGFALARRLAG